MEAKNLESVLDGYSDERIMNIIKQKNSYPNEHFELAKKIALNRKLVSRESLAYLVEYNRLKEIAEKSLNNGNSKGYVLSNMHENNKIPFDLAKEIVEKAAKSRLEHSWNPNKNQLLKVFGGIILAYLIIKVVLRILININS